MKKPDEVIWEKFHIHGRDTAPFSPWLEGANRNHLAELFGELGYMTGAEVGVRTGGYSKVLLDNNPNVKLFCIDPWKAYQRVTQEAQDGYLKKCVDKLSVYGERVSIMRMTSMEAFLQIPDDSLDFVYLDGCHEFDHIMMDLIMWSRKVRYGGIVSGHDYYNFYQSGVISAVNTYTYSHGISQWYVTRELEPSFFWVRPKGMSPGGFTLC